jgi:hypothetical protein
MPGIALRATNTHGEPANLPGRQPASHGPVPAAERADQASPTPAHTRQQTQPHDRGHPTAARAATALTKGVN